MKKIISAVLAAFLMLSCINVYGEEVKRPTLTVSDAVGNAINNSSAIQKLNDSYELNEDKIDSIEDSIFLELDANKKLDMEVSLLQLKAQQVINYPSVQAQKDTFTVSITKFFVAVIKAEKDLALYDKSIDLQKRQIAINNVKKSLGYISEADCLKEKNSYSQKLKRESKQVSIDNAHNALNSIMGSSLSMRYKLSLSCEYKPMTGMSLMGKYAEAVEKDPNIKTLISNLESAEFKLKNYFDSTESED